MPSIGVGLTERLASVFLGPGPARPSLRGHIDTNNSSSVSIDLRLLSNDQKDLMDQALQQAEICPSVVDLSRRLATRRSEDIASRRVGKLVDTYIRAQRILDGGKYTPEVVIAGKSGISIAALVVGAIDLTDALRFTNIESKITQLARSKYRGGMFKAETIAEVQQIRGQLAVGDQTVAGLRLHAEVDENTRNISTMYIGVYGRENLLGREFEDPNFSLGVLQELFPKTNFTRLKDLEYPLHTPLLRPFIGKLRDNLSELTVNQPRITLVGGSGNILTQDTIKAEMENQALRPDEERLVEDTLKRLRVSRPLEVGLMDHTREYLIVVAAVGVAGVAGVLALRKAARSQKAKKG